MKIFTHWVKWVKVWVMSKEKIVINHYLLTHTVALVETDCGNKISVKHSVMLNFATF